MSGGYVDQYDLCALLRNPTKIMARNCYINQIKYWFQVGPDHISGPKFRSADRYIETDRRVAEIATLYANIEVYTPRELC